MLHFNFTELELKMTQFNSHISFKQPIFSLLELWDSGQHMRLLHRFMESMSNSL